MAKRKKRKGVNNVIVVSDLHINCRLGLCPPAGADLDEGGAYKPSRLQMVVWSWWEEFWGEWVPHVTKGEPYAVVVNGDAVDGGAHHGNTTHISANYDDQERLALKVLRPVVEQCEGRYWHIRGTDVHAGQSGQEEERLARALGAVPDKEGRYARWFLWKWVGDGMAHISHHIGTSSRTQYETSAPAAEFGEMMIQAALRSDTPPHFIARGHRHRQVKIEKESVGGKYITFVTPGWQLRTPFAYKIAGARVTEPEFGGALMRHGDEDYYTRHFKKELTRPEAE